MFQSESYFLALETASWSYTVDDIFLGRWIFLVLLVQLSSRPFTQYNMGSYVACGKSAVPSTTNPT